MLQISVLGPVEITRSGRRLALPAGKTTELLVRLALDAGVVVRTDRLLDDLWDDAASTRRNTLQSKVAKLRRSLGDPSAVVHTADGYMLAVEQTMVDASDVSRRATAAADLQEAGDHRAALDLAASALAMFSGDILAAAGDGAWAVPHRVRLGEARLSLIETRASARLGLGEVADAIGELEAAVVEHPFREGLWALLVTALYREHRQAEALAALQRVRRHLADDLGLEPGPQLRHLERQILVHDAALVPAAPVFLAGNLPAMSTTLIGRDDEIGELCRVAAGSRLVDVVGPGGIGKTVTVVEAARNIDAPGGRWLARLETATNAAEVVDALIAAVGVAGGEAALIERLRLADSLVILDNCEHVLDAAADLVQRLLDAVPTLRIVCTSQVPLDVDGETVLELSPLTLSHSIELFTRRAASQRNNRTIDPDGVADLCRSLDGLPLAIELAAARTRTLSIAEISRRLDDRPDDRRADRLDVLSDPSSRRPERRRALRSTIRWSYDLLFPDDQRGLWALAAFAGGAPLAAVEDVLGALGLPASASIDVVGRLASRSLVAVDGGGSMPARYRLLDSIRAFAIEAATAAEAMDVVLRAHAAWFAATAARSTTGVRSAAQAEHLAVARAERANIDATLGWCARHDPLLGLQVAVGFGWAWIVLGDSRGSQRISAALAAAGDAASPSVRATALLLAGWIDASTGDLEHAVERVGAATVIADESGDREVQARCAYYMAYVVSHEGRFRDGLALTERSHDLYDGLDRPWDVAAAALFATRAAISAGDVGVSIAMSQRVQAAMRRVDDPWLQVRTEAMLGELARLEHRFDDAVAHIGRAAATSGRLGFLQTEAYQVASLGRAQWQAGDRVSAPVTLRLAVDKAEATGDVRMAALARVHLGRVLRAVGESNGARVALESAGAWHRAAGGGEQAALGECLLAAIDAVAELPDAEGRLSVLLDEARRDDAAHVEVFALDALARIAAGVGEIERALEMLAVADRRMLTASHFIAEHDRVDATFVRQRMR